MTLALFPSSRPVGGPAGHDRPDRQPRDTAGGPGTHDSAGLLLRLVDVFGLVAVCFWPAGLLLFGAVWVVEAVEQARRRA